MLTLSDSRLVTQTSFDERTVTDTGSMPTGTDVT
jgi:hypothetical protein